MPAGSLATIAADSAFPALAEAMDERYVLSLLRPVAGSGARLVGIDILNHKPGRRCTLRYRAETAAGGRIDVIAKWYRDLEEAARLYRRQAWLAAEAPAVGLSLPEPAGYDAARGVILQQRVAGNELRTLTFAGDLLPFRRAGEWLARLHALAPPPLLERKEASRELRKAGEWASETAEAISDLLSGVDAVTESMRALAPALEGVAYVPIHRDFYPANLIWDGEVIFGIDFDQLALGDPAVDAGAFISQTEKLALREGRDVEDVNAHREAFLAGYGRMLAPDRLAFFRAYTLLHVASAEVRRKRERWQELTRSFVGRAAEVMDTHWTGQG